MAQLWDVSAAMSNSYAFIASLSEENEIYNNDEEKKERN